MLTAEASDACPESSSILDLFPRATSAFGSLPGARLLVVIAVSTMVAMIALSVSGSFPPNPMALLGRFSYAVLERVSNWRSSHKPHQTG